MHLNAILSGGIALKLKINSRGVFSVQEMATIAFIVTSKKRSNFSYIKSNKIK